MKISEIGVVLKWLGLSPLALFPFMSLLLVQPAPAQSALPAVTQSDNPAPQADKDPLGRSTPHGTVTGFVSAAQRRDYTQAAEYLDTRKRGAAAEQLARELQIVLDRGLMRNLDKLSRKPDGDLEDGLRVTRDEVGTIDIYPVKLEILLDRVDRGKQGSIWLFSSETLALIPEAAEALGAFNIEEHLPSQLVRITIFSLPLYRWITLILLLALAFGLSSIVTRALIPLLRTPLRRITGEADDRALTSIKSPTRLILISAAVGLFSTIATSLYMRQLGARLAGTVALIGTTWLLIAFTDILSELHARRLRRRQLLSKIAMWALFSRLFKALLVVVAALWLLHIAGADLTAVLTGLGVGGIAIAFAAQKTLENLFGGVMIISDEPMRVGDFCRIADQMGTVEDIGLRSTRIRTLSRTVVAIPNGQLAALNIENFTLRDKFWLRHLIGLRYETSADQLRYVLAEIRRMLYAHPKVESDGARIRFVGFGNCSLDLEVFAYVRASEMPEFLAIQEDLLLRMMDIIEKGGTSIAFPAQTTYIARDTPPDSQRTEEAELQVRGWREKGELPFPDFHPDLVGRLNDQIPYPPPESSLRHSPAF